MKLGLAREVVDVLVEVELLRRSYRGRCRREREIFRVVGVRHGDNREHHWYVTNVPVTVLSPAEIATTYAARWEIELVFRELRTHLRLAQVASRRRVVVEALIYAALIGLAVSRAIWRRLRALVNANRRVSERRITDTLGAIAAELAVILAGVPVTPEQLRRWHALLSAEAAGQESKHAIKQVDRLLSNEGISVWSRHVVSHDDSFRLTVSRIVLRNRTPSAPRTPNAPRRDRAFSPGSSSRR